MARPSLIEQDRRRAEERARRRETERGREERGTYVDPDRSPYHVAEKLERSPWIRVSTTGTNADYLSAALCNPDQARVFGLGGVIDHGVHLRDARRAKVDRLVRHRRPSV